MKLILDLLGPPRLMGGRTRCELRAGSLTIGRSTEVGWPIPDGDRLISRLHLRIDADPDAFMLTDVSANGVFLNGSATAVGYGGTAKLANGDRIGIGDASIAVAIVEAETTAGSQDQPTEPVPVASPRAVAGGPFGEYEGRLATPAHPLLDAGPPAARQAVGADWMIASPALAAQDRATGHAAPPGQAQPAPPYEPMDAGPSRAGFQDLVERTRGLTIRRLAEAADHAGRALDAAVWHAFLDRVRQVLREDHERPCGASISNDKVIG